jgi:hypothetical protein
VLRFSRIYYFCNSFNRHSKDQMGIFLLRDWHFSTEYALFNNRSSDEPLLQKQLHRIIACLLFWEHGEQYRSYNMRNLVTCSCLLTVYYKEAVCAESISHVAHDCTMTSWLIMQHTTGTSNVWRSRSRSCAVEKVCRAL